MLIMEAERMESLHYLLMKTHTNLNRWILGQAAALGLSPGQPKILECLIARGECNQKSIAADCEIEQTTVGSILSRMERDGLVRRTQREGNRRSLYVSLTPLGRQLGEKMQAVFQQADDMACANLTAEQQKQLEVLLETVLASVVPEEKGALA